MNSLRLVQSAMLLVRQQRATIAASDREDALRQYWAHSQCRLQRWRESIHHFESEVRKMADLSVVRAVDHLPVIEEIVFSDVLTTVFTSLVDSSEQPEPDENPVAHNVLAAARQTRLRTVALLDAVAKRNAQLRKPEHGIQQICRGRRQAELWADLLLGYLPTETRLATSLGFHANRIAQFRANIASLGRQGKLASFTGKLGADIEGYFKRFPPRTSGNEELNRQIFVSMRAAVGLTLTAATVRPSAAERDQPSSASYSESPLGG